MEIATAAAESEQRTERRRERIWEMDLGRTDPNLSLAPVLRPRPFPWAVACAGATRVINGSSATAAANGGINAQRNGTFDSVRAILRGAMTDQ